MDGGWRFCSLLNTYTHTLYTLFTHEKFSSYITNISTRPLSIRIYLKCFLWSTENLFWRPTLHHSKTIFKYLRLLWTNIKIQMAGSGWPCLGRERIKAIDNTISLPNFYTSVILDFHHTEHFLIRHEFPAFLKIIVICYSHLSKWEQLRAYKHTLYVYFISTIFQSQALNSLRRECSHYCSDLAQALLLQQMWLCTNPTRCNDFRDVTNSNILHHQVG